MIELPSRLARVLFSLSLVFLVSIFTSFSVSSGLRTFAKATSGAGLNSGATTTVNLADYGAVGDGVADDSPALQEALDDLANFGGGTLNVPSGQYRLATPVFKEFGPGTQLTIKGAPSATPIVVAGNGKGLNLTSEFIIAIGEANDAITLRGLDSLLVQDVGFVGVITAFTDARVVLDLSDIKQVVIKHSEFYGLSSLVSGGAIINAHETNFTLLETAFLGCSTNSAVGGPIVRINFWHGILVRDTKFIDYGEKPGFFSKTPLQPPYAWILVGAVADPEPTHVSREVVMDNLFLDEGGFFELSIRPDVFSSKHVPYEVYLSRFNVNVNNLFSDGMFIHGARRVLIDRTRFGWSMRAGFAITLREVGDAVLDLIETFVDATRMRASGRSLTVLNSSFTSIDSSAPNTRVITTDTPEEDPAQYVRQRYLSVLNHDPDGAGHFYWTDRILRCADDAACRSETQAALEDYLSSSPAAKFSMQGNVVDQSGAPISGVTMSLTGTQSIAMQTNAIGEFGFGFLPTAGEYVLTPSKDGYSFTSQTFMTPSGDIFTNFVGAAISHTIAGQVGTGTGKPIAGAVVTVSGDASATTHSDEDGNYSFSGLPVGGNYTINVSRQNYTFNPSSRTFPNLRSDQINDFIGVAVKYTISGTVRKPDGALLSGAWVSVTDGSITHGKVTDPAGNYSFAVDAEEDYEVSVAFGTFVFVPSSHMFTNLSANARGDFGSVQGVPVKVRVTTATGDVVNGVVLLVTGSEMREIETNSIGEASFAILPEGSYEITPIKANYTFSPESVVVTNPTMAQVVNFTASSIPTIPILVSAEDGTRALALDAVLRTPEPFRLSYEYPWSTDVRTRVVLYVTNVDLSNPATHAELFVELEDAMGRIYPLTVEHAGLLEQIENTNRIIVRLHDELTDLGDVFVRVRYRGLSSEPLRIGIGHIGP